MIYIRSLLFCSLFFLSAYAEEKFNIGKYMHGTWLYANPYVELGGMIGPKLNGIHYREKGGYTDYIISGAGDYGSQQSAIAQGKDTYTSYTISDNSFGHGVDLYTVELEEKRFDGTDSVTVPTNAWAGNFDIFYSFAFGEEWFKAPFVMDIGLSFPKWFFINAVIPVVFTEPLAHLELQIAATMSYQALAVVNLTDMAYLKTGMFGVPGAGSNFVLMYGIRL